MHVQPIWYPIYSWSVHEQKRSSWARPLDLFANARWCISCCSPSFEKSILHGSFTLDFLQVLPRIPIRWTLVLDLSRLFLNFRPDRDDFLVPSRTFQTLAWSNRTCHLVLLLLLLLLLLLERLLLLRWRRRRRHVRRHLQIVNHDCCINTKYQRHIMDILTEASNLTHLFATAIISCTRLRLGLASFA